MYTKIAKAAISNGGSFFSNKIVQVLLAIAGILLGVIYVVPWVSRQINAQNVKNTISDKEDENTLSNAQNYDGDPEVLKAKEKAIVDKYAASFKDNDQKQRLIADARALPHYFGVTYLNYGTIFGVKYEFPIDPKSWTENDAAIGEILRKWTNFYPVLEELYYKVETESRSLKEDILKWLNASELKKTQEHWEKFGKKWL